MYTGLQWENQKETYQERPRDRRQDNVTKDLTEI
jgi:hypothetical protein